MHATALSAVQDHALKLASARVCNVRIVQLREGVQQELALGSRADCSKHLITHKHIVKQVPEACKSLPLQ